MRATPDVRAKENRARAYMDIGGPCLSYICRTTGVLRFVLYMNLKSKVLYLSKIYSGVFKAKNYV